MDDMDVSDAHFPVVVLFVELLTCYRSDWGMSGLYVWWGGIGVWWKK
jgi:hypothetical protein